MWSLVRPLCSHRRQQRWYGAPVKVLKHEMGCKYWDRHKYSYELISPEGSWTAIQLDCSSSLCQCIIQRTIKTKPTVSATPQAISPYALYLFLLGSVNHLFWTFLAHDSPHWIHRNPFGTPRSNNSFIHVTHFLLWEVGIVNITTLMFHIRGAL